MDSSANRLISNRFNVAVPLYVQIAESLLGRIKAGELVKLFY